MHKIEYLSITAIQTVSETTPAKVDKHVKPKTLSSSFSTPVKSG